MQASPPTAKGPLNDRLVNVFEQLSGQLQVAARYLIDHPAQVPLCSMRELARQAEVKPATMLRLAKTLGFEGFEQIRQLYASALLDSSVGFHQRADQQLRSQRLSGEAALVAQMSAQVAAQVAQIAHPESTERLRQAAVALAGARRIFCLGQRAAFPVAWQFSYAVSLVRDDVLLLDGPGGVATDRVHRATPEDVLLVVSVAPYTRAVVELARTVAQSGVTVVAITDSQVAPVAEHAAYTLLAATDSPSLLHAMTAAFATAEMLAALVYGAIGDAGLSALKTLERGLVQRNVHMQPTAKHWKKSR